MKTKLNHLAYAVAVATATTLAPVASHAAGTITFGDDQYISVGFGMRGSYSSFEDAANDGDNSNDFDLNSARLYVSGVRKCWSNHCVVCRALSTG